MAQANAYAAELGGKFGDRVRILISPLMSITLSRQPVELDGIDTVLFTSVNGVQGLANLTARRDFRCFCVGNRTQQAARDCGFNAVSAHGTAADLAALVANKAANSSVLYARGEYTAFDMEPFLTNAGLNLHQAVVYHQDTTPLSDAARDVIGSGEKVVVPLFSARTAAAFAREVSAISRTSVYAVCISQGVAASLLNAALKDIRVAASPDHQSVTREIAALI